MANLYSTAEWRHARELALARDGHRCTVSRLLGGPCSAGPLHVHHIIPLEDGGDALDLDNLGTSCSSHHPSWESLRRILARRRSEPVTRVRCPHTHRTAEARRLCEQRLARARGVEAAA